MDPTLKTLVETRARTYVSSDDPSHDWGHITRVLGNALYLAGKEGGDPDIIIPAVYFHDAVNYPKNDPRAALATAESAAVAERELLAVAHYPQDKIAAVKTAIMEHSFSAGIVPETLESKIVQDADRLEATGAIAVMRSFASTGQFRRPFYDQEDPFCATREPAPKHFAIDLFYARLLKVKDRMNTPTACRLAETRTAFLVNFLDQLASEITLNPDHDHVNHLKP